MINELLIILIYSVAVIGGIAILGIGGAFLLLWIDKKRKEKNK